MSIAMGWLLALGQRILAGCWVATRPKERTVVHRPSDVLRRAFSLR